MTRLMLVFFLSFPLLIHAQGNTPQESSLIASSESLPAPTALPVASSTSSLTPNAAAAGKVSRLVVPKLVHTVFMKDNGNQHFHLAGRQRVVLVLLTVNELGQPTDLHLPEPVEDALDVEVLAAVGKFRYEPGTLNGKPTPMTVRIHYVVPVGAIY